jgi:hypothetical protein
MQGSSYFRHQANTCMRLSASCTDQSLANHFHALARDLMAKAADADSGDDIEGVCYYTYSRAKGGPAVNLSASCAHSFGHRNYSRD